MMGTFRILIECDGKKLYKFDNGHFKGIMHAFEKHNAFKASITLFKISCVVLCFLKHHAWHAQKKEPKFIGIM
jgi:hypothetical protein